MNTLTDTAIYNATYWTTWTGLTLGWRFRAAGRGNLPATGPALIVANHQSFLDPLLFGLAAPRRLTYLARSTLFGARPLGRVIRHFGAVPIDRGFGKEGLQTVLAELARGGAVLVFPEGERTHTGGLQPLKPGVSLLIKRVTCPIVPAAVAGAFEAWPRSRAVPVPGPRLAAAFGRPIDPARYRGADRDELLADVQREIAKVWDVAARLRSPR